MMRLPRVEDFDTSLRGPETTSRVGVWLGLAFGICFATGVWSHLQYAGSSALVGPNPVSLYRVTQGLHVITGLAAIPLLLVKLWSVYPLLFQGLPRPTRQGIVDALERLSIAVLVASAIFQLLTGLLNIVQWYPWSFSFRSTHYALAWVAIGAVVLHVAIKLPIVRDALTRPLAEPDSGLSRRTVLRATTGATAAVAALTAGQSVGWLRQISVFAVRDGSGPQGLAINRTARAAGVLDTATADDFRLEIVAGDSSRTLSLVDLQALPQRTHQLPLACVEGWSRSAEWTGVAVRDLLDLVGAPADSTVRVVSLQTRGAFSQTTLPASFSADARTLLALRLNGETLNLDHGFPCRIIAPNRPGVMQTKWVTRLEVLA